MKDRILAISKGQFTYEPIKLQLSQDKLRLVVVSGRDATESFRLSNVRGTKVKGFVTTTDDIQITPQTFHGEDTEIHITFSASHVAAGTKMDGEIHIITDCGETSLPYTVEVVAPTITDKDGVVEDFRALEQRIAANLEDGALLFHSPSFKNVFLQDNEPETYLYTHLVKRNSKLHSLDEFLVATGRKQPYRFHISQTRFEYELTMEDVREQLTLTCGTWGAACIHVLSDSKFIEPEVDVIWSDDFKKDKYELGFKVSAKRLKDGKHTGRLVLETPYQREEITIVLRKKTSIMPIEDYLHKKKYLWAAYKNLLNYKIGKMRQEEYLTNIRMILEELFDCEDEIVIYLRAYLAAMEQRMEECEEFVNRLSMIPRPEYNQSTETVLFYLIGLYIKSIYTKTEDDKRLATLEARDYYENGYHIWPILYLLMHLEERYQTLTPKLLLEEVGEYLEKGCHSPLLYLEVVKIYQKDPTLVHRLTKRNIQVLYWGTKEELFDKEFALTMSFLAEHVRVYSDIVYRILFLQYKKYRLDDTLHSICSMLIRCEKMGHEYFPWFALGVQKRLRITELFEYYMYTFDTEGNGIIPQSVITYFQYENHLNDRIKAYLYSRVIRNKEEKPDNYEAYREMMAQFALRQLKARKLNENLGVLYEDLLKEENIKDDVALCLPELMFKQHLTCNNKHIEGVYVVHLETEKEQYYPIVGGQAHIDIYTPNYQLYFVDSDNRYYVKTIEYTLKPIMKLEKYALQCFENGSTNQGLMLHLLAKVHKKFALKQEDSMVAHMVTKMDILCDYYQGKTVLQLLEHYQEQNDDTMIRQILDEIDLSQISLGRCHELIELMAKYNLHAKAYAAIEIYGFKKCDKERLMKVVEWRLRQPEVAYEGILFQMCQYLYQSEVKSIATVGYLQKYFMGPIKEFFQVFSDSWLKELPIDDEVCEKLLAQVLFVNENPISYYQIFYDYYIKGINRVLVKAFLCYIAYNYIVDKVDITDDLMAILQKEAASTDNRVMQLAILKRYSKQSELAMSEIEYVDYHISQMVKEGIMMKFMQDFRGRVTLPYIVENAVLIEFYMNTDLPVNLLVHDQEGETKTYQMKQVFPGIFLKEFLLFSGEEFRYQIYTEETGKKTRRAPLKTDGSKTATDSFYALVNQMIDARENGDQDAYRLACRNYTRYQDIAKQLLKPIL